MDNYQAAPTDHAYSDNREADISRRLSEGRHRLLLMQLKSMGDFQRSQKEFVSQLDFLKWMDEQVMSMTLQRQCLESEFMKLSAEVHRLQEMCNSSLTSEGHLGLEGINLISAEETGWISVRRSVLAPLAPDGCGPLTSSGEVVLGKENIWRTSLTSKSSEFCRTKPSALAIPAVRDIGSGSSVLASNSADAAGRGDGQLDAAQFKKDLHFPPKKRRSTDLHAKFDGTSEQPAVQFELRTAHGKTGAVHAGLPGAEHPVPQNSGMEIAVAENRKRKQDPVAKAPIKFVAPVRKKADRENLQATECKMCTPFYDAVTFGSTGALFECRCNHVDNFRHRFRDLPPDTPEGFWNLGFDTECTE